MMVYTYFGPPCIKTLYLRVSQIETLFFKRQIISDSDVTAIITTVFSTCSSAGPMSSCAYSCTFWSRHFTAVKCLVWLTLLYY